MSFISVKERASVTIKGSHCHVVTFFKSKLCLGGENDKLQEL